MSSSIVSMVLIFLLGGPVVLAESTDSGQVKTSKLEKFAADAKAKADNAFATLNLDATIDLFNVNALPSLKLNGKWNRQVLPAYESNDYISVNGLTLTETLDLVKAARLKFGRDFPLNMQIVPSDSVLFITRYKSEKEARQKSKAQLKALRDSPLKYTLKDIPFSDGIVDKMQPDSAVFFKAQLAFSTGFGTSPLSHATFLPYAGVSYFLTGTFEIQILKLDPSRVRVRIVSVKKDGFSGEIGAQLDFNAFALIGNALIGKRVSVLNGERDIHSAVIMSDYIFNFKKPDGSNNQEVRNVYNEILSPKIRVPALSSLDPRSSTSALEELFVSNLAHANAIASREEVQKIPLEERSLIQISEIVETGKPLNWNLKLGIDPLKFGESFSKDTEKTVKIRDTEGGAIAFIAPSVNETSLIDAGYGLLAHDQTMRSSSVILPVSAESSSTDTDSVLKKWGDFVLTIQKKQNSLSKSQREELINFAHRELSPEIMNQTDFDLKFPREGSELVRLYARITMKRPCFDEIAKLSYDDFKSKMNDYLLLHENELPGHNLEQRRRWILDNRKEIGQITSEIYKLTHESTLSSPNKTKEFLNLQFNSSLLSLIDIGQSQSRVFKEIGVGYMISLLPADKLQDLVSVHIRLDATHTSKQELEYGIKNDTSSVANVVEVIENDLKNGGYDVRLQTYGDLSVIKGQVISIKDLARIPLAPLQTLDLKK